MIVCLNGQFVPEEQATISVFDRGFLYGDGLFETLRVLNGRPFRWEQHLERLEQGAEILQIALPFRGDSLLSLVSELIRENHLPDCLLRVSLSRGVGQRGYSPKGANAATFVLSLHPARTNSPSLVGWHLITSSFRLSPDDPLARCKTANKLPQVLARAQADSLGADDALLLNTREQVAESTSGNLFWIKNGRLFTPPLTSGVLPGITRSIALELCHRLNLPAQETSLTLEQLKQTDGIFLTLSSLGLVEVLSLDGHTLSKSPLTAQLHNAYHALLEQESGLLR